MVEMDYFLVSVASMGVYAGPHTLTLNLIVEIYVCHCVNYVSIKDSKTDN